MSEHARMRTTVAGAAGLGVLGDVLMRAPGAPSLNAVLWAAAGVLFAHGSLPFEALCQVQP